MAVKSLCKIDACGKPARTRGWCNAHHKRFLRHGDPTHGRTLNGESERYYREVVLTYEGDDCLIWPCSTSGNGYGHLWLDGRVQNVHRLVCEATHGTPPSPKYEAAHSCGNGHLGCCAKRHLSWKTRLGNMADMVAHGRSNRGKRIPTRGSV